MKSAAQLQPGLPAAPSGRAVLSMAVLTSPERIEALKAICPDVQDLSQMAAPDVVIRHGGGLILIEQGLAGWEQLLLLLAVEYPSTAVIVVSDHLPAHMVRTLMKFEAWDVLAVAAGAGDVIETAARLAEARTESKGVPANSVCWAFRGAVGGAGVSTLVIESAFALARLVGPGKVCLVDLNLADGMSASLLEAVPKLDLQALSAAPEDGVSIIASPRNPEADALASAAAILRLLDVTCAAFPFVILDMPRHMMPWTKSVMAAVDQAVIVSQLTVPSLHAAADMCRDVDALRGDASKARLVLNRTLQKKQFLAGVPVGQAEKAIERKIDVTVTSDWDAARTAVNLGKPIAKVKPKSALVIDVDAMVRKFVPDGMIENAQTTRSARKVRA
jgi:pilus assembly protein CpaE